MAEKGAVHSIIDDIHERARLIQKRVIEAANEMIPRIKTDIFTEFGEYQQAKVEELFRSAVNQFYAAYRPAYYERNFSLYNALEYEPDEYGIVDDQIDNDSLFSWDGVSSFERGGGSHGLFDLVFMEGWHGGAAGIDRRGDVRTSPHYRTPEGFYYNWGKQAVNTESPHDIAMRNIHGAESMMDYEFEKIAERYTEILTNQLSEKANMIAGEVFSDWR